VSWLKSVLMWASHALACLIRGVVRCTSPLIVCALFMGLLAVDQGRDAMLIVLENAVKPVAVKMSEGRLELPGQMDGLFFMAMGVLALSTSVWYSMRWLLLVKLPGLPLPSPPDLWQRWLPRVVGALPAVAVARVYAGLEPDSPLHAAGQWWSWMFWALAIAFVLFCWARRPIMGWLSQRVGDAAERGGERVGGAMQAIDVTDDLPKKALAVMFWSVALSLIVGAMLYLYQQSLSRVLGSAAIAALALASINLFGSFVLSLAPLRRGLPPLGPLLMVIAGLFFARWNDNHEVQAASPAMLGAAVPVWAPDHEAATGAAAAELPRVLRGAAQGMRPLLIASEGGGIRAAYWTAAVLEALDDFAAKQAAQVAPGQPRAQSPWSDHLYALSGVSGGSLGVTAWLISNQNKWCEPRTMAAAPNAAWLGTRKASDMLAIDFLAPAVEGLLYQDLLQRLLFWKVPAFDRSRGLEEGWQRAFASLPGQPMSRPMRSLYAQCPGLPRLILNATAVETGRMAPLTPLNPRTFTNAEDVMQPGTLVASQALAGLVHHSARFPLLSPAGTVTKWMPPDCSASPDPQCKQQALQLRPWRRLVDGGYYDNSGVYAVLDVLRSPPFNEPGRPRPVLLMIRNDPSPIDRCSGGKPGLPPRDPSPSNVFPEVGSIVLGLYQARSAHAATARETACSNPDVDTFDLTVPTDPAWKNAPLGWSLSDASRLRLREAAAVRVKEVGPALLQALSLSTENASTTKARHD